MAPQWIADNGNKEYDLSVEARAQLRERYAQPRLEAMHLWLVQTRKTVADGAALARAIDYSLKRWPALARYAQCH